jgi:hypothetical protein
MAFPPDLGAAGEHVLPYRVVPFPRGFAFGLDGTLFLASGMGPNGEGDDAVFAFGRAHSGQPLPLVTDPDLSPLDLAIAPNGNIIVSSEQPFGSPDADTSIREYDSASGRLVRVFSGGDPVKFRRPRGLRFGPEGNLYCVAQDEVVAFDFATGECLGAVLQYSRLHGQALAFFP